MSNQAHSFLGNLTRDPEIRTVNGKNGDVSVVSFAVAVNGRAPEDTVFFECDAWGQQAETIAKHFKKGKPININDAEARTDSWEDKNSGEKRSRLKFRVNRFSFVPGNKDDAPTPAPASDGEATPAPVATTTPKATSTPRRTRQPVPAATEPDDDIPF